MLSNPRTITRRSLAFKGLSAAAALFGIAAFANPAFAQDYRYNPEHRRPVEVTIDDLKDIASRTGRGGEERERYDHAIRHLYEFRERLHERGRFDKDKLDDAIGNVQSVIDHNHMGEEAHERLRSDVGELRRLREHFDEEYRYSHSR